MRKIFLLTICLLALPCARAWELPAGWASERYPMLGGREGRVCVLRSDGGDQKERIAQALRQHDVLVLDGAGGPFRLSEHVALNGARGKTIVGINHARVETAFTVTDEIRRMLDDLDVKSLSSHTDGGPTYTLSNGAEVAEQCEHAIRQAMIDRYGDDRERYRYSGFLQLTDCEDIIVRNLDLQGPGALDVGGTDLISLIGSRGVWIDHCAFTDGLDGNLDITNNSDAVTVSWCRFGYSPLTYNHALSSLTNVTTPPDGLNITWMYCHWAPGCQDRLPWAKHGMQHIFNCYYECPGANCIRTSENVSLLAENNYFVATVKKPFADGGCAACTWRGNLLEQGSQPSSMGPEVTAPYPYTLYPAQIVPELVTDTSLGAGPTLYAPYPRPLSWSVEAVDLGEYYTAAAPALTIGVSGFGLTPTTGTMRVRSDVCDIDGADTDGALRIDYTGGYVCADITLRAHAKDGDVAGSMEITGAGTSVSVPVRGRGIAVSGVPIASTQRWTQGAPGDAAADPSSSPLSATMTTGAHLSVHGTVTPKGGPQMTAYRPTDAIGRSRDEDACLRLHIDVPDDAVFIPETLSLDACRVATDMSAIDIVATRAGRESALARELQPQRNSEGFSQWQFPLATLGAGDDIDITIYVYYLSANKQVAFSGITVTGSLYTRVEGISDPVADSARAVYYRLDGVRDPSPRRGVLYLRGDGSKVFVE